MNQSVRQWGELELMNETKTPQAVGYRQPAEWEKHASCWTAWPYNEDWGDQRELARQEIADLCRAIADVDPATGQPRGESLNILVRATDRKGAEQALAGLPVRFHEIPYGDVWLRDTAPIFLVGTDGTKATVRFKFNGWGEKYLYENDPQVSARVAEIATLKSFANPLVLEGGSVEVDGEGTCLTTKQCLLNQNRNPGLSQDEIERELKESLGVEKILWLDEGLLNDHTDGHIDTLVRFAAPGTVLCMEAKDANDPNKETMDRIIADLHSFTDARGRKLSVVKVPSPGKVISDEGKILPASYLNFYIANTTVVVPIYGSPADEAAVSVIASCFPGRKTIGLSAKAIVSGGGAFHCITQQQPL